MEKLMKYKICLKCDRELPLEYYSKHSCTEDGLTNLCKDCITTNSNKSNRVHKKDNTYLCTLCDTYKEASAFNTDSTNTHRDGLDLRCRECRKKQSRKSRIEIFKDNPLDKLLTSRLCGARNRAKNKGLAFNLTKESLLNMWEEQNGKCAISGIEMTHIACFGRIATNLSIDKIDPLKGYTKENTQLVCMAVNQMKSDLSMEELITFSKAIVLQFGHPEYKDSIKN